MADFTQTITNQFELFGASPVNYWGSLEWGTDNWGTTEDFDLVIGKVIGETSAITTANVFDVITDYTNSTTITTTIVKDTTLSISVGELVVLADQGSQTLQDAAGFYHVFSGNTTDGENRVITDYTEVAGGTGTWSIVTSPSSTWS